MAKNLDILEDTDAARAEDKPSPVTVDGLRPSTTYKGWKARYHGETATTALGDFTTNDEPLTVPTAPTIAVTAGDSSLAYTITDANADAEKVSAFKVLYQSAGATDWTTVDVSDPTKLTGTIDSLTNGTEYSVKVVATNATGDSADSAVVTGTPVTSSTAG